MDESNPTLLARIERLTELVTSRLDQVEARLRALEQDNSDILVHLIALKAGLENAADELLAEADDGDDPHPPADLLH